MEVFIHAANATFLVSFLVRDILKLRLMSVLGAGLLIVSFSIPTPVVWSGVAWQLVFTAINGVQIVRLILERRPVRMTVEEHELHQLTFRTLSPHEMVRVLATASWRDAPAGERLVEAGKSPACLMVLTRGELAVERSGETLATLGPGQFAGEMAFLTGAPPKADVVARAAARLVELDSLALKALLAGQPELRASVQGILGADLALKLRGRA